MLSTETVTTLIQHVESLRQRIDALDVAATGICAGMRLNTLGGDAAYQLLDMISGDLKARTDTILRRLTEPAVAVVIQPRAGGEGLLDGIPLAPPGAAHRDGRPMPASSIAAR